MNNDKHAVLAEDVMAFLDGELSAADAQAVSAHIDGCEECARLGRQFDSTSQSLSAWSVQSVPRGMEHVVLAARNASAHHAVRAPLFLRFTFWNWKQRLMVVGGTLAAVVWVATSMRTAHHSPATQAPVMVAYRDGAETENSARESLSQLQAENSKSVLSEARRSVARLSPSESPTTDEEKTKLSHDGGGVPMIARTVSLTIVVKDFAASRSSLDAIVSRHHGYAAQLTVTGPENAARALQGSLRVPAPELAAAVRDLRALGRVENESQAGEEVTGQHEDLGARLRNARETEQRFLAILEQRTGKLGDVLEVEERIARVRGDIERMEAEQKTLEHRVDFATIQLQLTEEYKAELNGPVTSVSTRLHNALVAGYRGARETVLGVVIFLVEDGPTILVWLAILAVPAILLWRRYRRSLAEV
ncbi:MAG: DUF4349 domain-containing protein [Acidobacteria bacterium]|nr:DUF4349 domain-containing protein [Acidobacteriota bacterium]